MPPTPINYYNISLSPSLPLNGPRYIYHTARSDAAARANKRKSENKREMRQAESSPEDAPANWRRVKEAGVMFWINDVTGVATDECPHESLRPPGEAKKRSTLLEGTDVGDYEEGLAGCLDMDVGQEEGTGALVYDSSEFQQAMRILDGGLRRARPSSCSSNPK